MNIHRLLWSLSIITLVGGLIYAGVNAAMPLPHPDDPVKQAEHLAMLDLAPSEDGTHLAINSGNWFSPTTWAGGVVPVANANVVITRGVTVSYTQVSTVEIDTIRVDGVLAFSAETTSQLLVDTIIVDPDGQFTIGSETTPVDANHTVNILFTSDTPINIADDPTLLGRGLISHGQARIYGADKLDFIALVGDANAGNNTLTLDLPNGMATPLGWRVGDQLVLGGTYYDAEGSDTDNSRYHDEELTITAISGNQISFTNNDISTGDNSRLRYDHLRPIGYDSYNLKLYVANTTRNVRFATVNGDSVPIMQRAHVMFMHNKDVQVHNAGFYELGRTDKSVLIDDIGTQVNGQPGTGTNVRGRYSLHFHRTGAISPTVRTPQNALTTAPFYRAAPAGFSHATGNAVVGSPGWGIVHHDSYLDLEDNVVFNVLGSAIVAEAGNEVGSWRNNIVIKTTGDAPTTSDFDNHPRSFIFDFAFNGEAYWVQGASQIMMEDNIAISSFAGIDIFSGVDGIDSVRDVGAIHKDVLPPDLRWITTREDGYIDITNTPMRGMDGFVAYNVENGIVTWNHMRNDGGTLGFTGPSDYNGHYARSRIENFQLWNVFGEGIFNQYSAQIDFIDGLILGNLINPVRVSLLINGDGRGHGVGGNGPTHEHLFQNIRVEGFERGFRLPTDGGLHRNRTRLVDSYFANNISHLTKDETGFGAPDAYPDNFEIVNTTFVHDAPNQPPIAAFETRQSGGAGAVFFDGSPSYDADPDVAVALASAAEGLGEFGYYPNDYRETLVRSSLALRDNAIAAYGWDWDADGVVDDFGRFQRQNFSPSETFTVALTVWDSLGATSTVTQSLTVTPTATPNLLVDSTFGGVSDYDWWFTSDSNNDGWKASSFAYDAASGAAHITGDPDWRAGIAQVVRDNYAHRGTVRLNLDLRNVEGNATPNQILLIVYGVNGEFDSTTEFFEQLGPYGAIPMTSTILMTQLFGGTTFDWTTFGYDVDLGSDGYEQIIVQLVTSFLDVPAGDYVALDNVFMGDRERPLAIADSFTITDSQPITITPLVNDVDLMGDTISITGVTQPQYGFVTIVNSETLRYTPPHLFVGQLEFTYTVSDEHGNHTIGTITVQHDRVSREALILEYNFDERSGRTIHDSSPHGANNERTRFGDVAWADGVHGGANRFDGNRDFIWLNDSADLNDVDTTQRTISLWFNADDVLTTTHQVLYEQGYRGRGLTIHITDGHLHAGGWHNVDNWATWHSSAEINANQWHHVALIIDSTAGTLSAYLDGTLLGSGTATSFAADWPDGAIGNVYEGASFADFGWDFTLRSGYAGLIDEVKIYNRALSADEIAALANQAIPSAITVQSSEIPQSDLWLVWILLVGMLIATAIYFHRYIGEGEGKRNIAKSRQGAQRNAKV